MIAIRQCIYNFAAGQHSHGDTIAPEKPSNGTATDFIDIVRPRGWSYITLPQCVCYANWNHRDVFKEDRIKDELKEDFTEDEALRWLVAHREAEDALADDPEHRYFAAYVCILRDSDLKYTFKDYKAVVFSCACEHFDRVAASEEVSASEFLVTQLGPGVNVKVPFWGKNYWK